MSRNFHSPASYLPHFASPYCQTTVLGLYLMACFSTTYEGISRVFSFIDNDFPQILDEEIRAYVSSVNGSESQCSGCLPEVVTGDQLHTSVVDNALRGVDLCGMLPAQPRFTINDEEQALFSSSGS